MRGSTSRRILLKLSGEAFQGPEGPLSTSSIDRIIGEFPSADMTELALVVGGGNVLRGARSEGFDRIEGDFLGMLATILNALALRSQLERSGRGAVVQSAIHTELTDPISIRKAADALSRGSIVIFAGGTGSPLVTTDTAAALRAVSIGADVLAKASNVAGVYAGDPSSDPKAKLLTDVSFDEFLERRYGVMDQVAVEICREHALPIEVFDFRRSGALRAIAAGEQVGTRIGS
jgi:uridylate kinase